MYTWWNEFFTQPSFSFFSFLKNKPNYLQRLLSASTSILFFYFETKFWPVIPTSLSWMTKTFFPKTRYTSKYKNTLILVYFEYISYLFSKNLLQPEDLLAGESCSWFGFSPFLVGRKIILIKRKITKQRINIAVLRFNPCFLWRWISLYLILA